MLKGKNVEPAGEASGHMRLLNALASWISSDFGGNLPASLGNTVLTHFSVTWKAASREWGLEQNRALQQLQDGAQAALPLILSP